MIPVMDIIMNSIVAGNPICIMSHDVWFEFEVCHV